MIMYVYVHNYNNSQIQSEKVHLVYGREKTRGYNCAIYLTKVKISVCLWKKQPHGASAVPLKGTYCKCMHKKTHSMYEIWSWC